MSAIAGAFDLTGRPLPGAVGERMLGQAGTRGDRHGLWHDEHAVLGVSRFEWELQPGFSGRVFVVQEGDHVVAADASLYYRDDLERALRARGERVGGRTPSHYILAAYRAWGEGCVERLEGDFAFVLWDRRARRVLCARDFIGKRPLYYAEADGALIVASTIGGVREHPACPADLNLVVIAETAAGLFAAGHETCYRDVYALPAGHRLSWHGSAPRVVRYWHPPRFRDTGASPFADAAEELRALLTRAVEERLAPSGVTSVWLSGGWDSTAVFAAGRASGDARAQCLHPVSISYPPGDSGREDELIAAVAERWRSPVHWLDIRDIHFFENPGERAAARDEPYAHVFETWNRALARGSAAVGAHVALDGNGGDQFFSVPQIYLADLFRQGRWLTLAREWRAFGSPGLRPFFRLAVQPVLPPALLRLAALARGGRPLVGYLEQQLPEWIDQEFACTHGLAERQRVHTPPRDGLSCAAYAHHWYLTHAYFPRVHGCTSGLALEEGVESRSPLFDRRVIEFAASRPRWERFSALQNKRLLRRSMTGLLPDRVLAPRRVRTGTTRAYLAHAMREHWPGWLTAVLSSGRLIELGIVDPVRLREASAAYLRGERDCATDLFYTLQTELWLRARLQPAGGSLRLEARALAAPPDADVGEIRVGAVTDC